MIKKFEKEQEESIAAGFCICDGSGFDGGGLADDSALADTRLTPNHLGPSSSRCALCGLPKRP